MVDFGYQFWEKSFVLCVYEDLPDTVCGTEGMGNNRLFSMLNESEDIKQVAYGRLIAKLVVLHKMCSCAVECCGC